MKDAIGALGKHDHLVSGLFEELVPQAFLAFAQGHHAPPDGGDMLADGEIDALDERRVNLPTLWSQTVFDASQRTEHHAMTHLN